MNQIDQQLQPRLHHLLARVLYLAGDTAAAAEHALSAGGLIHWGNFSDQIEAAVTNAVIKSYTEKQQAGADDIASPAAKVFELVVTPGRGDIRLQALMCVDARRFDLLEILIRGVEDSEIPGLAASLCSALDYAGTGARNAARVIYQELARRPSDVTASIPPEIVAALRRTSDQLDLMQILQSPGQPGSQLALASQLALDRAASLLPAEAAAEAEEFLEKYAHLGASDENQSAVTIGQHLSFESARRAGNLFSRATSDVDFTLLQYLIRLRVSPKAKPLINMSAIVAAGLSVARTCSNEFFNNNMNWMAQQRRWSQFSIVAAVGGAFCASDSVDAVFQQLGQYLPYRRDDGTLRQTKPQDAFAAAGALYGLGIAALTLPPSPTLDAYLEHLVAQQLDDVVRTGLLLCIGFAAAGRGCAREGAHTHPLPAAVYQWVCTQLHASAGLQEPFGPLAAGLAAGLLHMGCAPQAVADLGDQPDDSLGTISGPVATLRALCRPSAATLKHPYARLGCALGAALFCYASGAAAEPVISALSNSQYPEMQLGAAYALGLAHAGTNSLEIVHRLLTMAVSTTHEIPARAAVTAVGFVCCTRPELAIRSLAQLSRSFSPAIRAGCAIGLALAAAGTGRATPLPGSMQRESDRVADAKKSASDAHEARVLARIRREVEAQRQTSEESAAEPDEVRTTPPTCESEPAHAPITAIPAGSDAAVAGVDLTTALDQDTAEASLVAAATAGRVDNAATLIEPLLMDSGITYNAALLALSVLFQGQSGTEKLPFVTFLHAEQQRKRRETLVRFADAARKQDEEKREKALREGTLLPHMQRKPLESSLRSQQLQMLDNMRHDQVSRSGAAISLGMLYAGGCRAQFSLTAATGIVRPLGIISGLLLAVGHEWLPLYLPIAACLQPLSPIAITASNIIPAQVNFAFQHQVASQFVSVPPTYQAEQQMKRVQRRKYKTATLASDAKDEGQDVEEQKPDLSPVQGFYNGERMASSVTERAGLEFLGDFTAIIPRSRGFMIVYNASDPESATAIGADFGQ